MTFKDIIGSLVSNNFVSDISLSKITLSLVITLLISLWIFISYKKISQDEFYSKNFNISLALMPTITTSIILAMQSNLVISLGMVGALSIVRYRTAIKSSLDLFFMFWAISVGIVCGSSQYLLAVVMSLIVSFLLIVLSKFDFTKTLLFFVDSPLKAIPPSYSRPGFLTGVYHVPTSIFPLMFWSFAILLL